MHVSMYVCIYVYMYVCMYDVYVLRTSQIFSRSDGLMDPSSENSSKPMYVCMYMHLKKKKNIQY